MKVGLVICGPDVAHGPLALLSGAFEEKVMKARRLGCDGVELMVRDPSQLDWERVKATLDAAQLGVPQIVTGELFGADGLCLATADDALHERTVARLRAVVDLGAFLGAIVNIGRVRGQLRFLGDRLDAWRVAVERLRGVAMYAAERGVRIAVEPLNRYETDFIFNAEEGKRMIEQLGMDNVGLMLDLFHMNIEDATIEDGLRTAGDRLWHVHIADSNRRYPGSGHLDFDRILRALRDMGYEGYLSGEMLPLPDADTAGERTVGFLKTLVQS